jgi:hypothetical protein
LDENFARLITTFDEVPLFSCAHALHTIEICDLHRIPASPAPRRLHENSVDLKRKTAEVSSGRFLSKVALRAGSSPQGLRRPRFSFFLFTCQTARNHDSPTRQRTGGPSKPHASD